MGCLGHLVPSLDTKSLLREELNAPKSPFKWFQEGPPKKGIFDPKNVIFLIFPFCGGPWDRNKGAQPMKSTL